MLLFFFTRIVLLLLKHVSIDNECYPSMFLNSSSNANVKVSFRYFCDTSHIMGSATVTLHSRSKLMMNVALFLNFCL